MKTQFLTFDLTLPPDSPQIVDFITQELERWGQPLRWAITAIPGPNQIRIEAVVTVAQITTTKII